MPERHGLVSAGQMLLVSVTAIHAVYSLPTPIACPALAQTGNVGVSRLLWRLHSGFPWRALNEEKLRCLGQR